jgi:DNA-directed RNA polymerase subunit RPC12/RpoP
MDYLCSECSTQLSKFEMELNELYPVGKLFCEYCQSKHEREIIKKMADDFANELDFYDYPKTIEKLKKEEGKK